MKSKMYLFVFVALLAAGCSKDPIDSKVRTFKDSRDKHVYKYVKIGTQTWMAENLAYLPAVSLSSDGSDTSPYYYVYGYDGSTISEAKSLGNYTSYGVLYNWEAAKISCPAGWRLPTDDEWAILENNLGAIPGKKMKSLTDWAENGNGDNSSGFNALPGGFCLYYEGFYGLGYYADFWSSSEYGASGAWLLYLNYYLDGVGRSYDVRSDGLPVRCLQNN